jgi:hypothetical protein
MNYIHEIDDAVSKDLCLKIISRFENDSRKVKGETVNYGLNENIKKSTDLRISSSPDMKKDWDDINNEVANIVREGLISYIRYSDQEGLTRCGVLERLMDTTNIGLPVIEKMEKNGFYTWHNDGRLNRVFTYILYLNDVDDDNGGSTEFLNGKIIQPKTGKLVIFPSNIAYINRSNKLKNGSKYIITDFVYEGSPIYVHPNENSMKVPTIEDLLNSKNIPTASSMTKISEDPENDETK